MSLADELRGRVASTALISLGNASGKRVHRIGEPEEIEEEKSMPRKPRSEAPTIEEAAAKAAARKPRKKRKYTRRQSAFDKAVDHVRGPRAGEPTFIVDDAGRVAILHDEIRIDLTAGATKRLVLFLEKHAK